MQDFGPTYCEAAPFIGMMEPVNTLTNLPTILLGVYALWYVRKHAAPGAGDLYALAFLLLATGIGSTLWHGFREPIYLTLDTVPGFLFLFLFTFTWARLLLGALGGAAMLLGFLALRFGVEAVLSSQGMFSFFLPTFITASILGTLFIYLTHKYFGKKEAVLGAVTLTLAVLAALMRSVDLTACAWLPFGTHFLWHMLLGLAAFCGIVLLVACSVRISARSN